MITIIYSDREFYNKIESFRPIVRWWFEQQYRVFLNNKPKILVVWGDGFGEQGQINRIRIAAQNVGINLKIVSNTRNRGVYDSYINNKPIIAANTFLPDLVLTIERNIPAISGYKNYLVLDQSSINYVKQDSAYNYLLKIPEQANFDCLLPTFSDVAGLQQALEKIGKQSCGLHWYPTSFKTNYTAQQPKRLFYPGGTLTDSTRASTKYKAFFSLLDKTNYLEIYGKLSSWHHTPNSFRGFIPFDDTSMFEINNKAGVTLVLHARDHLNGGLPTGRIFEAAAANTVIISDNNAFIRKYFGDNVLYIDVQQDALTIFKQIDRHMQWIFSHPQEAKFMADKCHAIFLKEFAMEDQLLKLLAISKKI